MEVTTPDTPRRLLVPVAWAGTLRAWVRFLAIEMGKPSPEPLPVYVIIPALNEAAAIGQVVRGLLQQRVRAVYVVDNGSTDGTGEIARQAGAVVVRETRKGYGAACLAGLRALPRDTGIVVFVDGDGSDDLSVLGRLVEPIRAGESDFVVGTRVRSLAERGSLTVAQRVGNFIACAWLRSRFGLPATDLGPFRAIRMRSLESLGMRDDGYGWTVEMQIKAAQARLRYREVPVPYRRRVGRSKISGTVRGALAAGVTILSLLARYDLLARPSR